VRDLKTRDFELEVRSVSDSGSFSGYASTFGTTPDSCGDVIAPGAFAESLAEWKAKGALPPCLWQHRADQPLGPFTKMIEDERGLFVEGQLLIKDVAQAREAHALVKAGTISGLSIGFQTIADAFDTETEIRTLTKVKIWEASLVTFPANEGPGSRPSRRCCTDPPRTSIVLYVRPGPIRPRSQATRCRRPCRTGTRGTR